MTEGHGWGRGRRSLLGERGGAGAWWILLSSREAIDDVVVVVAACGYVDCSLALIPRVPHTLMSSGVPAGPGVHPPRRGGSIGWRVETAAVWRDLRAL